ncbi:MAG: Rrf2 family transcriptional regulator [Actinomycetota bacterium]|nr:Rrf2 family transcriptional regulator [Actinomycetota bacterium]MDI7251950.1 Rrf2 family transcriptional regulator [Actinomycetota bacterium]
MRMPTKARYGLRAMLDLAMHGGHEHPVLLRDVASRQMLSERYLGQVFILLRHAGLVRSARGAKGGFMLSRPPESIDLLEIVEACIGDLSMVECVRSRDFCARVDDCAARLVWEEVTRSMREVLAGKSLADLVGMQRRMEEGSTVMYYI